MEDLAVEVCDENRTYYKAFVTDVFEEEVLVAFENDWLPESKFPFAQVRLPPKDGPKPEFQESEEVEVFSRVNDQEACGWWKAIIRMIKGSFLVVEYLGWEYTYTEIVASERLRPKNLNPPIDKNAFHKIEIEIPEELREFAKMDNAHKDFQKAIGAAVCRYVPERGVLLAISRHENMHRYSIMLQEMHFRSLSHKEEFSASVLLKVEAAPSGEDSRPYRVGDAINLSPPGLFFQDLSGTLPPPDLTRFPGFSVPVLGGYYGANGMGAWLRAAGYYVP